MDGRLVVEQARSRRSEGVLHSGKPARRIRGPQLRPLPAAHQTSTQGAQRRLAPAPAELLPPLPTGCPSCRAGGHINEPCRLSLCHSTKEQVMSNDTRDKSHGKERVLDRRKILLGGTTLAAAS